VFGGWPVDTAMLDRYVGRFVLPEKNRLSLVGLEYIDFRGSGRDPVERITIHQNGKPVVATRQK
jgi:hypothetical protein